MAARGGVYALAGWGIGGGQTPPACMCGRQTRDRAVYALSHIFGHPSIRHARFVLRLLGLLRTVDDPPPSASIEAWPRERRGELRGSLVATSRTSSQM